MAIPDGPALALDDILRTLSPSPPPAPQHFPPDTTQPMPIADNAQITPIIESSTPPHRIPSPEPLDHSELAYMRARAQALDHSSEREFELAAMVRPYMFVSRMQS